MEEQICTSENLDRVKKAIGLIKKQTLIEIHELLNVSIEFNDNKTLKEYINIKNNETVVMHFTTVEFFTRFIELNNYIDVFINNLKKKLILEV